MLDVKCGEALFGEVDVQMLALPEGLVEGQLFNDEMRRNCTYPPADTLYPISDVGQLRNRFCAPSR